MRPEFIPSSVFRAWLPTQATSRFARIDGILAASYVARCIREGRPIRSAVVHGQNRHRLLDIVARARADAVPITPPFDPVVDAERQLNNLQGEINAAQVKLHAILARIGTDTHRMEFSRASIATTGLAMLSEREIVASSTSTRTYCGVYFLVFEGRIVYVGQSLNVLARIGQHADKKKFDAVAIMPCAPRHLDVIESLYIHMLRPPLNGRANTCSYQPEKLLAPLTFEEIVAMASRVEACNG